MALAAVRATREAQVRRGRDDAAVDPRHAGGRRSSGDETFDGETEVATFPGDLPTDADLLFESDAAFRGLATDDAGASDYRFLRFRPPRVGASEEALPHIRLDRALQFLIGDRLT